MNEQNWITLAEYSRRHKVSISTLRRRIKNNKVEFKYENGRYLLFDSRAYEKQKEINTSQATSIVPPHLDGRLRGKDFVQYNVVEEKVVHNLLNKLVDEMKAKYEKEIQKQKEQISNLSKQLVNLQTLVNILEDNKLNVGKSGEDLQHIKIKKSDGDEDTLDVWIGRLNETSPEKMK